MVWGSSGAHLTAVRRLTGGQLALKSLELLLGVSGLLRAPALLLRQEVIFSEPLAATPPKPQDTLLMML